MNKLTSIKSSSKTKIKRPDAIIFDWDDTLFDHEHINSYMSIEVIKAIGSKPYSTAEDLNQLSDEMNVLWHKDKEACCKEYFHGHSVDDVFRVWNKFMDDIPLQNLRMLDNATEILVTLKEKGVPMIIVSNKPEKFLKQELNHFGFTHYFDSIISQQKEKSERKPNALPILKALDEANKQRELRGERRLLLGKSWYLGDHLDDAGAAIGARAQLFIVGSKHRRNIKEHFVDGDVMGGIDYLKDLKEFKGIVDAIPSSSISEPSR